MDNTQFTTLLKAITNNSNLNKVGALGGTKVYNDASVHSGLSVSSIQPREATVISAMTGVNAIGVPINFLTQFNISGVTLDVVDLLVVPNGYVITSITLASGSILAYS